MHPLAIYQCQFLLQKFNVQNVKEIILSSNVLLNCVSESEDCCTNANFMVWILRVKKESMIFFLLMINMNVIIII